MVHKIYGIESKKQLPDYLASPRLLLTINENEFAGVLEEAIYLLPNVLQAAEWSLPVWPRRSLHYLVHPELSFSLGVHTTAQLWWKLCTSKSLSYTHCLQKNPAHSVPPAPQSVVLEVFFLCEPNGHCILSTLLSLLSPHGKDSPPIHFLVLCTYHTVSLQLWKSFFQSSDWFPGSSMWSDLKRASLKGWGMFQVPQFLHKLHPLHTLNNSNQHYY